MQKVSIMSQKTKFYITFWKITDANKTYFTIVFFTN